MLSVRIPHTQMMFGASSTGGPAAGPAPPAQSLKRRRRGSLEQQEDSQQQQGGPEENAATSSKRRRNHPNSNSTFQLSFLSPPLTHQDPYKSYQPTPPIDSDSDSSSDRFSARFEMAVRDEDRDEDMLDEGASQGMWKGTPRVVIGPPTPVSEMGPGMGRLEVGDVDMDRRQGEEGAEKKRGGFFRMGFRADCEKCRLRVPGHYSHY